MNLNIKDKSKNVVGTERVEKCNLSKTLIFNKIRVYLKNKANKTLLDC